MASKSGQEAASAEHVEELLDAVDLTLDRLKTLYEQYFLGIQKQAPAFIHSDVERKLRDLTQLNIRNTGLRYRLATLQQKFGSYNSYWRRTLRQIENGTYLRNLAKIGREAARNGTEIPEEILAAMPKRMREQVLRDRDQALAVAKRRKQLEDAADEPDVGDAAAVITDTPPPRDVKTASGAHVLSEEDADIDFNELFAAFEDDAPKLERQKQPTRPPAARRSPTTRPPLPRMPVPATKPPVPSASAAKSSATDVPPPPSATTPQGRDASTPVARVALKQQPVSTTAIPRPGSQPPNPAVQATGPIPRPPPATPTQAIPRPVGHAPTGPTQAIPRPVGHMPSAPQTGPVPRPQTGPVPTATQPVPRVAPSQQSRPVPVVPGSATQTGPVPVESMSGPFPRIPSEKSGPTSQRTQAMPKPAAPLRPPPGMTEADVNALHAKYVKAKEMIGEKVDAGSRDKLLRTITQTAPKIMQQYKASGVDFSVVVKDNQVVIKAKPKT